MLALTRKIGESIMIGDNIEVTVIATAGDQIKLGINAPKSVSIHRKEVYLQIQDENKAAASATTEGAKALQDFLKKQK